MEYRLYELLGVGYYRKFVLLCKSLFNKLTKNKHDNDNYFLRGYKREDVLFLRDNFMKNLRIHLLGVFLGFVVVLIGSKTEYKLCGLFLLVWNLYSVMLQRYNIIRIDKILKNRKHRSVKNEELC